MDQSRRCKATWRPPARTWEGKMPVVAETLPDRRYRLPDVGRAVDTRWLVCGGLRVCRRWCVDRYQIVVNKFGEPPDVDRISSTWLPIPWAC